MDKSDLNRNVRKRILISKREKKNLHFGLVQFIRPGVRMAMRKMSNGAYVKRILKLSAAGYDLPHHLGLKDHWARHGTNKFVPIKKRSGMLEAKLPAYLIPNLPRLKMLHGYRKGFDDLLFHLISLKRQSC
ncbi:hypothetical protein POTOM_011964 [Populus tomentosa]|uniref:GAGA-binding transcriptional activator n=1 Tax=Populus tomentosa TaxID=118781 RepID=A0A8X8DAV1_POPTO|nr:hypothetical protein POTOM_011964 [Populus tomentosa]